MVASRFAKLFAVAASAAFVCSMVGVPAYALTDTNLDERATGTLTGGIGNPGVDGRIALPAKPAVHGSSGLDAG